MAAAVIGEIYLSEKNLPSGYIWGWHYEQKSNQINELHFRGQSIKYEDGDYVVALVGDSQVESARGRFKEMPEKKLQLYLSNLLDRPVKVFTVGAAGYGQDQELIGLQKYFLSYRADLVVVWETLSNDIWDNTFPTHWPENGRPKPTYWLDREGNLQGPQDKEYPSRVLSVLAGMTGKQSLDKLWEKKYLPPPYRFPVEHSGEYRLDDPLMHREGACLLYDKTHAGMMLVPPSERILYGIRLTNSLLLAMQNLARQHGAIFVTFTDNRPDYPLPDGVYRVEVPGHGIYYPKLSRKQYWENASRVNAGLEFLVIDVTTPDFRYDVDPHLNPVAVDQVMKDLATNLHPYISANQEIRNTTAF